MDPLLAEGEFLKEF